MSAITHAPPPLLHVGVGDILYMRFHSNDDPYLKHVLLFYNYWGRGLIVGKVPMGFSFLGNV